MFFHLPEHFAARYLRQIPIQENDIRQIGNLPALFEQHLKRLLTVFGDREIPLSLTHPIAEGFLYQMQVGRIVLDY